jgi:hypothetical protein
MPRINDLGVVSPGAGYRNPERGAITSTAKSAGAERRAPSQRPSRRRIPDATGDDRGCTTTDEATQHRAWRDRLEDGLCGVSVGEFAAMVPIVWKPSRTKLGVVPGADDAADPPLRFRCLSATLT